MRIPLPFKLMAGYLLVAGLIVGPSLWYLRSSLVGALKQWETRELQHRVEALRDHLSNVPDAELDHTARDLAEMLQLRVTLIRPDGVVISDSEVPAARIASMENHAERPEVVEALRGHFGHAQRMSSTLDSELVYGATAMPSIGPPRMVVRVARPVSVLREAVSEALRAMRFATGVGVTVALVLSLGAAMFVATPLRRLRDAARSFARAEWVPVKRLHTGDELEDLTVAFDELGRKLRAQLIEVGTQEALLTQAVESLPLPALVFDAQFEVLDVNGALRRHAGITAANEGERIAAIAHSPRLAAAREIATQSGLPTELSLTAPGDDNGPARRALLAPLVRPSSAPLWLLLVDLEGPESEARGPEAVHRLLRSAERVFEQLWARHAELRPELAPLRVRLDDIAHAAGRAEPVGVEPTPLGELVARTVEELRAMYPDRADQLVVECPDGACKVAESAGMAARAMRLFVGGALRALPRGRTLELTVTIEPSQVKISVEGSAPPDLEPARELARALGADAGRVPQREREAAWLGLPRA